MHVQEVLEQKEYLNNNDIQIFFVGNGNQLFIEGFKERNNINNPVYTQPSLLLYESINATNSVWSTIHPRATINYFKAYLKGENYSGVEGDTSQQGGAIMIDPQTEQLFIYTSGVAGDNIKAKEIINQFNRMK
ncbi:MAG: hypothetical protein CL779_00035 [Chloroflexi bacterium]|nr:hypothetical protein [Chloroflexota bacterium]|tara:strand:- start:1733 stop:2131 length:399 start_codon:yes stop_codon:yes gene_type:complete